MTAPGPKLTQRLPHFGRESGYQRQILSARFRARTRKSNHVNEVTSRHDYSIARFRGCDRRRRRQGRVLRLTRALFILAGFCGPREQVADQR